MIVKVCGITRREDAEAAVEAGADALGFIFYKPSPRYIAPERAREIGDGLAIWKVGVFVEEQAANIEAVMRAANLDVAQFYGGAPPRNARIWQAVRSSEWGGPPGPQPAPWPASSRVASQRDPGVARGPGGPPHYKSVNGAVPEALFLDSSGNGVSFDWHIARGAAEKVIIAGGLDALNVQEAIRIAQPWGVDASSRLESAPGIKDHEKVRQFIRAAREFS